MSASSQARIEHGINWAAAALGGRVIARDVKHRWRPMVALDIERPDGKIMKTMLRGFRNPGYMSEEMSRALLEREAHIYRALADTPVKLPRYHGYDGDEGWLLMERVEGDYELSKLLDPAEQQRIMRQYIDNMVLMHKLNPDELDLPQAVRAPRDWLFASSIDAPTAVAMGPAEPLFELCIWWLNTYKPGPAPQRALCLGDMGTEQFIFDKNGFKAIFDIEVASVNDPLLDACSMRNRDMVWPVPGIPELVRYWAEKMDRRLERAEVTWWTMICLFPLLIATRPAILKPDPRFPADTLQMFSSDTHHRRGSIEALAEFYGVVLPPVELPAAANSGVLTINRLIADQLRTAHIPAADDQQAYLLSCTAAIADSAAIGAAVLPALVLQTVSDIAGILGHRENDLAIAMEKLTAYIRKDPEKNIDRVLPVLHAMEVRREAIFTPIKQHAAFACNARLQRLWDN